MARRNIYDDIEPERIRLRLGSTFSLGMLPKEGGNLKIKLLTQEDIDALRDEEVFEIKSVVGHKATADALSTLLGREIAFNREEVSLRDGERFTVAQIHGRLPEGKVLSVEELKAFPFSFFEVSVEFLEETRARLRREFDEETQSLVAQEALQEGAGASSVPNFCPVCHKPINGVARLFGIKSDNQADCQCIPEPL